MSPVDAVGHVRHVGQRLEPVRAAGRNVKRDLLVAAQFEALPVTVCRRSGPEVHDDIEDRAVGTPYELRLALSAPRVQAAHDPAHRTGDAVLDERGRVDPGLAHYVYVEGTTEETALVDVRGGLEQ